MNMELLEYDGWILRYDREATKRAYEEIETGDPENCGCDPCLNFAASRDRIYPEEFRWLLDKLGIDPKKEVEVYHLAMIERGIHKYGGWFHFIDASLTMPASYRCEE